MKPIDIGFVKPPEICNRCGQKMMGLVANVDSGVNQLMHHPTVILLELAEVDGQQHRQTHLNHMFPADRPI